MENGAQNALDTALARKARLKALKGKKDKNEVNRPEVDTEQKPKLKFRSYNPLNEDLKEKKLPKAKPEDVESQIQGQLEAAKDSDLGEINLTNLAPKKPDWDLKRDIKHKLDKLERRTQKAIVELIHDRLKGSSGGAELAAAVASTGRDREDQNDSD